ncbi:MAG: ferritin-like domain-containing protein [Candidatus Brocadiia bacterium]
MQSLRLADAIAFAMELEKNGNTFYANCRKEARDKKVAEIFSFLQREEEKHFAAFEKMKNQIEDDQPGDADAERVSKLLDAYAESFLPGQEQMSKKSLRKVGPLEAIGFAVQLEKNSIEYYQKLRTIVPQDHISTIDDIITAEESHREKLERFKESLQG